MSNELQFKISAALKDIIGRDLITDDYIAVFELVKNSFDAHANRVDIYFVDIYSDNAKVIIKDNGKGMSYDDLKDKWLFVAYSAKKEGTEDENFDYRDKIYVNRPFAGAKGIGRFSCDRLGKRLYLETIKRESEAKIETLFTDWESFEGNASEEFINISVTHERKRKSRYDIEHGTVLEISELRSTWNRGDFIKLKESLAKLINPARGKGEKKFQIFLHVAEEEAEDAQKTEAYEKVNGEISNYIFSALNIKTTKIKATVSEDGKFIETELTDGNTLIYKITEANNYSFLSDIEISLYYMNLSAKLTFTRRMGLSSIKFGHVFVYKNGFRIYPYGEPGEDSFGIDKRKAQGKQRYLGTYDILGQIEIFSKQEKIVDRERELKESSTRGDGLIKTTAYYELVDGFFFDVLKRLEKYVVDVQKWGLSVEDESSFNVKARVPELIAKLTGNKEIIDFETSENFYEMLEQSQSGSAEAIVKNLNKIALESGSEKVIEHVKKATLKLAEIQKAREEAEQQVEEEARRADEATQKLREKISENLFLKSINTSDFQEIISLIHHIGIYAGTIDNNLKGIALRVQNNIPLTNQELNNIIKVISFETKKILNIAAFATKANFKLHTEEIDVDLKDYIREYLQNIIPTITDKRLKILTQVSSNRPFIKKIKPIEINIVIDNLVNNAKKAGATELKIIIDNNNKNGLDLQFIDNGQGIDEKIIKRIYDFGFTTTDGSGLGLYHVKEIMKSLGGNISAANNESGIGATFKLEFK